jgi:hypothetical protein
MCNCKKNKRVETKVIMGTPEPQVVEQPEIDHFNNIDTIEPIQNGEGTTGENG